MKKVIDNIFYRFYKMFRNGNIHHTSVVGSLIFSTLIIALNISSLMSIFLMLLKIKHNIPAKVEIIITTIPILIYLYFTYYKDKKYEKIIEYYEKENKKDEMKRIVFFGLLCFFSIFGYPLLALLLRHVL